jgi:hypothetical protein
VPLVLSVVVPPAPFFSTIWTVAGMVGSGY